MKKYPGFRNNQQIHFVLFLFLMASLVLINACKCDRDKPTAAITVKGEVVKEVDVHIGRFEKDLFSLNLDSIDTAIPVLKKKYGPFLDLFNRIVMLGSSNDPQYPERLKGFITDYYQSLSYNKVLEVFPDVNSITTGFQKAFTRYREFFPEKKIPRIYTYISGWNNMVASSDSCLGIGLDMFLGHNCDFYVSLQLPKYVRYTLQREYIVPLGMQEWAKAEFSFKDSATNLLSKMLYEGKVMFFVKKIIPDAHDTLVFGFRPDQIKWCFNNEKQMWTYLLEKKLLFSSDYLTINKLTGPAPFTSFFTSESPGKACVWLGYKIIESYMHENKDVTLSQLMNEKDYQRILRKSNYKP